MAKITIQTLLDAGCHYGHQTRRWNPKMKSYIFGERNGIYILDLKQTMLGADKAYTFLKETCCSWAPRSRPRSLSPRRPSAAACPTSTSAGSAACSPTS